MDRMADFVARYPTADAASAPGTAIDSSNPYFSGYVLKQLGLNDGNIEREFFNFASTCKSDLCQVDTFNQRNAKRQMNISTVVDTEP